MKGKQDMNIKDTEQKKRIESLDIFRGVLIFFVVFGHFLLPMKDREYVLSTSLFLLIYSFHMPAFIFLSGYFYYESWKRKGTGFKSLFSLLILFFLMKILLHISDILFYDNKNIIPDFLHESSTPWYISTLIFFRLSLLPLELCMKRKKNDVEFKREFENSEIKQKVKNIKLKEILKDNITIYTLVLLILTLCISMLNCEWQKSIKDFLSLDRVISFAPFFYIGFLYKKYSSAKKTSIFEKCNYLLFGLGAMAVITFIIFFSYLRPYSRIFYGPWGYRIAREDILPIFKGVLNPLRILYIPYALSIAYFVFIIFCKKENFLTSFLIRFGVYSLPIFVLHRPIRDAFDYLVLKNVSIEKFGEIGILVVLLIISFIVCILLGTDKVNRVCRFK